MVPDGQKVWTDGRNGRTDNAKTISLRLRLGIKRKNWGQLILLNMLRVVDNSHKINVKVKSVFMQCKMHCMSIILNSIILNRVSANSWVILQSLNFCRFFLKINFLHFLDEQSWCQF